MYSGKTVFAQLMDCLPWSTFSRLVARWRTTTCEHFHVSSSIGPWRSPN